MTNLYSDATGASRHRLELARTLAATCPPSVATEIAVTGSAARGVADEHSDVEINLWVDRLPAREDWHAWLDRAGATDISPNSLITEADCWAWITCRYRDVWVEIGWAEIAPWEALLQRLIAGEVTEHRLLSLGWMTLRAVPVKTTGRLARWQEALTHYPDNLPARIIADQTQVWSDPHVPFVRLGLAARGQRFGLAMRLQWDMMNLLRILFTINHRWDQDLKWTDERAFDFPIKPENLSARLNDVFILADLRQSVLTAFRLIEDTLLLVPPPHDVSRALANIRRALQALESS